MTDIVPTITSGPPAAGVAAADVIEGVMAATQTCAVVVATGRSPMTAYQVLAERVRDGLDTRGIRVFQLDEYVGVGRDDERSLSGWMDRSFVVPLEIDPGTVVRFDGLDTERDVVCAKYERAVRAADGFDLAIVGLGPNGHLGFNEPPSDPDSSTRVVELSTASLTSNASYWGSGRVPHQAFTAGMDLLLAARCVVLIATGGAKHDIVRRALDEPPTPSVPASFLQGHPNVHFIVDLAAWDGDGRPPVRS
jgi:glucosamine-6-phosphate deaminase